MFTLSKPVRKLHLLSRYFFGEGGREINVQYGPTSERALVVDTRVYQTPFSLFNVPDYPQGPSTCLLKTCWLS